MIVMWIILVVLFGIPVSTLIGEVVQRDRERVARQDRHARELRSEYVRQEWVRKQTKRS